MKAITLDQPWATLVAYGAMRFVPTTHLTDYVGPIAIHASEKNDPLLQRRAGTAPVLGHLSALGQTDYSALPRGVVLATGELVKRYVTSEVIVSLEGEQRKLVGKHYQHPYLLELQNVLLLPAPVPAPGHSGLWEWVEIASAPGVAAEAPPATEEDTDPRPARKAARQEK